MWFWSMSNGPVAETPPPVQLATTMREQESTINTLLLIFMHSTHSHASVIPMKTKLYSGGAADIDLLWN